MDGNIIIDFNKIEDTIAKLSNLSNQLEDSLNKLSGYYEELNENEVWHSKAEDVCFTKCEEISKQYPDIIDSIKTYIAFLDKTRLIIKQFDENVDKNITEEFG